MAQTDRLHLPLLGVAQAQKEMTHNEALAMLDAAVQAVVVAVAPATVPSAPTPGQCWIVGPGATGDWAGQDSALAVRTAGGWRFIAPFDGMTVWSLIDALPVRHSASLWIKGEITGRSLVIGGVQLVGARRPAINGPTGGSTVDSECRAVLDNLLVTLRTHGLITS